MINKTNNKNNKLNFDYYYIYNLIKKLFNFDENQYSLYIKDVIQILFESEKEGNTFVDINNKITDFELFQKGWPDLHLKALRETGLIESTNSPIIFKNSKLSWIKWNNKFEEIEQKLSKRIKNNVNKSKFKNENDLDKVLGLLEYSDLILIEGGPGTGKTTLVIESISHLIKNNKFINIGIAAPTGKATGRMKEAIDKQLSKLNGNFFIDCQTLHSWIDNSRFNLKKLKFELSEIDILVIDEMSMVAFDIFESTINNISSDCKIILIGDSNQLPPINSHSIWNYIFEISTNNIFEKITIKLNKIYRNSGDIINLSRSVITKSKTALIEQIKLISANKDSNVKIFHQPKFTIPSRLVNDINIHLNDLKNSVQKLSCKKYIFEKEINNLLDFEKELANDILTKLNSQIILCQKNKGLWSVENIHEIILYKKNQISLQELEEGIPIMCTKNNSDLGLSNGDLGVLIGKSETRRFLFKIFDNNNEQVIRLINPSTIENIVPAIAITIHKSQGSEAGKVCLLWDKSNNAIENSSKKTTNQNLIFNNNFERRLFYTAITRAKNNLDLYYS